MDERRKGTEVSAFDSLTDYLVKTKIKRHETSKRYHSMSELLDKKATHQQIPRVWQIVAGFYKDESS